MIKYNYSIKSIITATKGNNNMKKNNELVESLNNLCEAFHNVLNVIESDNNYLDMICNEYPFELSFDEMMHEVMNWRDAVEEKIERTRDTYFTIDECTEEELEQLRWALYYDESDMNDIFDEKDIEILDGCSCPEEIPFEILEKVYGHISFVDEDFWCNC
jgi:hypothetical protein